jgi:hypothetical protein
MTADVGGHTFDASAQGLPRGPIASLTHDLLRDLDHEDLTDLGWLRTAR